MCVVLMKRNYRKKTHCLFLFALIFRIHHFERQVVTGKFSLWTAGGIRVLFVPPRSSLFDTQASEILRTIRFTHYSEACFQMTSVSGLDMSWPCLCNSKSPWASGQEAWCSYHTRKKHWDRWCWPTCRDPCLSAMVPKLNHESPWETAVNTQGFHGIFYISGETQKYLTFVRNCANY